MKPTIYLRIASLLTLLHAVLHTVGGVYAEPGSGPASAAVAAMKANQFAAMGHMRTYFEFYRGMGLAVTIFLTVEAIVFWLLASLARRDAIALRPVLAMFTLGYMAFAVNSMIYFFWAPVVVEAMIALCLGLAFVMARRGTLGTLRSS